MFTRFIAIAFLSLPFAAIAQPNPQPFFNVVTLETSATSEVPADTLAVTLFTEEQGPDPAQLVDLRSRRSRDLRGPDGVRLPASSERTRHPDRTAARGVDLSGRPQCLPSAAVPLR